MFVNESVIERSKDPNSLLVFLHTQRTGGSNLSRWVGKAFKPSEVYWPNQSPGLKPWHMIKDLETLDGKRFVAGFSRYHKHAIERPVQYISVVRHPFYRIVSIYHMSKGHPDQFLHEIAIAGDFETFYRQATALRPYYLNNLMCQRIGGKPTFESAIQAMVTDFGIVCATSELDKVTARMAAEYHWPLEPMVWSGKGSDEERYAKYRQLPVYDEIMQANAEDMKLYEYVIGNARNADGRLPATGIRLSATITKLTSAVASMPAAAKLQEIAVKAEDVADTDDAAVENSIAKQDAEYRKVRAAGREVSFGKFFAEQKLVSVKRGGGHATLGVSLTKTGEWWDKGKRPFDTYCKRFDILPEHRMVDYGCGSLRIGGHFIRYLDPGHYFGLDIIPDYYEIGKTLVGDAILKEKRPRLGALDDEVALKAAIAHKADVVYSSAVSYHVHPDDMPQYFWNLKRLAAKPGATLFFDANVSDHHFRYRGTSWSWALNFYINSLPEFELVRAYRNRDREELGVKFNVGMLHFRRKA